jgi:hypothetical protein
MRPGSALWVGVGAGLLLMVAAGCSSNKPAAGDGVTPIDDLAEVAGLLKDYTGEFNRGPARLENMAKNQPLYPRGYQAIKSGKVVVIWGVKVPPTGGSGTGVVAYEKKAETEGGSVLLENGEIKTMTAAEFQAAPKAKP